LQTCAVRAPHTWPAGHVLPQSTVPPQPLPMTPQYWPFACVQLIGVHAPESGAAPHTFGVPAPPQVWPPEQPPQSIEPPQPSPTTPQYLPLVC
jgi:hypothetical protein